MARPRKYPDDDATNKARQAERQAAFRQRSSIIDRAGLEELRALLERFHVATRSAAGVGDELAAAVVMATPEATLRRLCQYFEQAALPKASDAADSPKTGT